MLVLYLELEAWLVPCTCSTTLAYDCLNSVRRSAVMASCDNKSSIAINSNSFAWKTKHHYKSMNFNDLIYNPTNILPTLQPPKPLRVTTLLTFRVLSIHDSFFNTSRLSNSVWSSDLEGDNVLVRLLFLLLPSKNKSALLISRYSWWSWSSSSGEEVISYG